MRVILGIDPGAHGAIAVMDEAGDLIEVHDMPVIKIKVGKTMRDRVSAHGVRDILSLMEIKMAVLERVGGMTGQSASAAFTFGYGCGEVAGLLIGLGVPITFITPQRWKKGFGLSADKGSARQRAMQLWPKKSASFARLKDDGRAEAALIARFSVKQGGNHDSFDR